MADGFEPESDTARDSEAENAMHMHRPKPLHGWREVSSEIGVIVVGIVIAICLEQAVELVHHRHQRQVLEEEFRTDTLSNREILTSDIAAARSIINWATSQASGIERAGPTGALALRRLPVARLYRPDAGVWPAAKANGEANLLTTGEQNWFEDLNLTEQQIFLSNAGTTDQLYDAYAALNLSMTGHATETPSGELDLSALDPAQRTIVVERLRIIAEKARRVMIDLVSALNDTDYILATPGDQLDNPNAMAKFRSIARENAKANPDKEYIFNAR
jgi:hypothetical protein